MIKLLPDSAHHSWVQTDLYIEVLEDYMCDEITWIASLVQKHVDGISSEEPIVLTLNSLNNRTVLSGIHWICVYTWLVERIYNSSSETSYSPDPERFNGSSTRSDSPFPIEIQEIDTDEGHALIIQTHENNKRRRRRSSYRRKFHNVLFHLQIKFSDNS